MPVRAIDDKPSDTLVVVSGEGFWTGSSTLPHLHQSISRVKRVSDAELFARQDALEVEAAGVLADLDLFSLLRTVGHPTHTGSSALGLMVARDIDVTTVCPSLDPVPIFDLGRSLATHPRIYRVTFRDDTGRWNTSQDYPDGLYWMVEYVADPDIEWKLDLWFLLDGTTQFDLEHMKTLPARLTPEIRATILRIKEAVAAEPTSPKRPSYEIYEAVLDHGVRTPDEYARHRAAAHPSSGTQDGVSGSGA